MQVSMFSAPCKEARILVVQHSEQAPGGNFCRGLLERGARLTFLMPMNNDVLPEDPEDFDGLVVLGGPQQAFDDELSSHFPHLMELMRLFDSQKKPVAGICLGCQLLARAHGGRVWPLDSLELGFVKHRLTREGEGDSVLGGLELPALMEFHEDSFDLPPEASLLVEGEHCINQCFKVGNASYGFQFHLEVDHTIVRKWIKLFRNGADGNHRRYLQHFDDAFFQDLSAGLASSIAASEQFCDRVSGRWLALAWQ
jgi:GMP synthase-like glutamine amidotransferase